MTNKIIIEIRAGAGGDEALPAGRQALFLNFEL